MKQHGALFTSENRLAIREGRKTQTRRIPASFKEINEHPDGWEFIGFEDELASFRLKGDESIFLVKIPWAIGDELYIKEPHYLNGGWEETTLTGSSRFSRRKTKWTFHYNQEFGVWFPDNIPHVPACKVCTGKDEVGWFLRSPLFMPKWAARDWLRVTGVKVERLQSISEQDIKAEGLDVQFTMVGSFDALERFAQLWDSINGKKHPWESNPWVLAYTFERILREI